MVCFFSRWNTGFEILPIFHLNCLLAFQYPIPIGNNRFYRKWFEEPSTRSISTRHTYFRPNHQLIDLPFHFSFIIFYASAKQACTHTHSTPAAQCYWTFSDRHAVDASTPKNASRSLSLTHTLSLSSAHNLFSEAQSTKAHIDIIKPLKMNTAF